MWIPKIKIKIDDSFKQDLNKVSLLKAFEKALLQKKASDVIIKSNELIFSAAFNLGKVNLQHSFDLLRAVKKGKITITEIKNETYLIYHYKFYSMIYFPIIFFLLMIVTNISIITIGVIFFVHLPLIMNLIFIHLFIKKTIKQTLKKIKENIETP